MVEIWAKRVIQRLPQEVEVSGKGMPVAKACIKATQWNARQQRSDRYGATTSDDVQDFSGEAGHKAIRASEQVLQSNRCLKELEIEFQPTESTE